MSKFDHSDLDGKLLQLLLAVLEAGSVTGAALRLGVTQSAVSHLLDKLRAITGDPLFVKSGRGIVATARAEALGSQARELLSSMETFAHAATFESAHWQTTFTIAANDFQRDLLLPLLMEKLRAQAPQVVLRVIPSDVPSLDMLRQEHCQLVLSPRPPDGSDILQKRLFEDSYRVFFDPACQEAPRTRAQYLAAEHITVVYAPNRQIDLDQWMDTQGIVRNFRVLVPGFAGLAPFIQGSRLLATVPGMLQSHLLRGFASVKVPVACPKLPMFMVWHLRHQHSAAHQWMRQLLESVVPAALSQASSQLRSA